MKKLLTCGTYVNDATDGLGFEKEWPPEVFEAAGGRAAGVGKARRFLANRWRLSKRSFVVDSDGGLWQRNKLQRRDVRASTGTGRSRAYSHLPARRRNRNGELDGPWLRWADV